MEQVTMHCANLIKKDNNLLGYIFNKTWFSGEVK